MSLENDGVWKSGVWATTVWKSGVWYELVIRRIKFTLFISKTKSFALNITKKISG